MGGARPSSQFIQTRITFELDNRRDVSELEKSEVQVRDRIISVLRKFTADELARPEGIGRLKVELIETVSPLLLDGFITDVFFTELVVQ